MLEGQGWPLHAGHLEDQGLADRPGHPGPDSRLRRAGTVSVSGREFPTEFRSRVRRLRAAADDLRSQQLASRRARPRPVPSGASCERSPRSPVVLPEAGDFGGQLAVVPGTAGVGHRRRPESPGPVGRQERREHSLAHADSRPRAFQPHRLGSPHLRHQRHQHRHESDASVPACTATATRRTIARATAG